MKAVLASPLPTSADVVMPVYGTAFRAHLLISTSPPQLGQEQACLVIGHRTDRFLGDRDGVGRQPKMRGHGRTLIQDCGGHGKSGPCRYATDLGMAFLNYLLAVKATRNLASVRDFLDGLAPDYGRGSQRTCRQIAGSIGLARTRKRMPRGYNGLRFIVK